MQTEPYVVLRPFMVEELGLKGSELVAYALIYGFSQDGESRFTGSAQHVADWCGIARRNAIPPRHEPWEQQNWQPDSNTEGAS